MSPIFSDLVSLISLVSQFPDLISHNYETYRPPILTRIFLNHNVMTAHQSPAFRLSYMSYTLVDVLLANNTASKVTVDSTKFKEK